MTFSLGVSLKLNVPAWLRFELAYYEAAVQPLYHVTCENSFINYNDYFFFFFIFYCKKEIRFNLTISMAILEKIFSNLEFYEVIIK